MIDKFICSGDSRNSDLHLKFTFIRVSIILSDHLDIIVPPIHLHKLFESVDLFRSDYSVLIVSTMRRK